MVIIKIVGDWMERNVEYLLDKYYNENGQEKLVRGERWSSEHKNEHISEQRLQMKVAEAQRLGFRLSDEEKLRIKYLIRFIGNDFNKINRSLSNEQVLVMIICFIKMEKDPRQRGRYYKKLREYDISDKQYISFLISLLKEYRS